MSSEKNDGRISVIIVSWNVREFLVPCINSIIAKTSFKDYEIIVVDNASSDGTVETVKNRFPSVKLIENGENLGFARACNIGAKKARAKYLFFLNPDTELREKALDNLLSFLEKNMEADAVGAKLLWPDGNYQESYRRFPGTFFSILEVFEFHYYFPGNSLKLCSVYGPKSFEKSQEIDWVVGAAFAVRREIFGKINGFDEDFFMYSEDVDLCKRIKNAGGKVYFCPDSKVVHYRGKSSESSDVRGSEYYKSLYLYHLKHSGNAKAFVFRLALSLWCVFYVFTVFLKVVFLGAGKRGLRKIKNKLILLKWAFLE